MLCHTTTKYIVPILAHISLFIEWVAVCIIIGRVVWFLAPRLQDISDDIQIPIVNYCTLISLLLGVTGAILALHDSAKSSNTFQNFINNIPLHSNLFLLPEGASRTGDSAVRPIAIYSLPALKWPYKKPRNLNSLNQFGLLRLSKYAPIRIHQWNRSNISPQRY